MTARTAINIRTAMESDDYRNCRECLYCKECQKSIVTLKPVGVTLKPVGVALKPVGVALKPKPLWKITGRFLP